jgi:hypothetical protein
VPSAAKAEATIKIAATVKARTAMSELRRRLLAMGEPSLLVPPHLEELNHGGDLEKAG